jgi:hypothetical protein
MFGIFDRRPKQPPLTEYCTWLSEPANFLKAANAMAADPSTDDHIRAKLLSLVIMGAAGKFDLRGQEMSEGLRHYFRDTDLDVITAEAIVWIFVLMMRLCRADQKKDRETINHGYPLERIGYGTFPMALRLVMGMIEAKTGFDFREEGIERRKMYREALERGPSHVEGAAYVEPFASVVLGSVGRRSLADPIKNFAQLPLLEQPFAPWTMLCAYVGIFCSNIPPGFYETFKSAIDELIDRGIVEI